MHHPKKLGLIANLILCFVLQTLGADKYTDENRPYEFGFKIDGQQHRHESKDEDGIIMGEFGFVTADDVYHVTVYATDKEGRFKILSMKNIHLKSTSDLGFGAPTSARQGHALSLPPTPAASVRVSAVPQEPLEQGGFSTQPRLGPFTPQAVPVTQAPQPRKTFKSVSIEPPANSCSSCSRPTTTTRAPPPAYNQVANNNNYNSPNQIGKQGSSPQNQQVFLSTSGQQNKAQDGPISTSFSPQEGQQSYAPGQQHVLQRELVAPNGAQFIAPQPGHAVQNNPGFPSYSQGPGVSNTPNRRVQGGPSGSPYSAPGGQQNYLSSQQNIPQGGFIASGGAQSFAPQPSQIPQNYPGPPNYSQGPGIPSTPNNIQSGISGSSHSPQGGQQNYPSSQPNIPQTGLVSPGGVQSFAPQPGQIPQNNPGSPNYSQGPGIPSTPNNVQGGSSGSSHSLQGVQQNYPSSQQNIPQGELVSPDGVQSFAPQPGQIPQNYPGSPNYSQRPGIPSTPINVGGRLSGSSQSPREGQPDYPSNQQNIPQGGLVSPGGVQPFAPIPDHTSQINPGSPSYSQGPGISNAPNNYPQPGRRGGGQQAELFSTNPEEQNRLFSGNNNPYAGAGPSGFASSVPDSGNFRQNIAQQAGLSGPTKAQSTAKSSYPQSGAGERTSKQYKGPEQQFNSNLGPNGSQGLGAALGARRGSAKPMLYAAQMQIVDKNTDIYALGPNEQKGLPPGLSHGDMTQLLYTFNYTVGFHGHFEEGYANGAKQGYYFVTGRNGVRTRIDYVADNTGFHPKVSQEILDLLSEDVPKPETEKDEKYGLKGYEFKWLYYPVETR